MVTLLQTTMTSGQDVIEMVGQRLSVKRVNVSEESHLRSTVARLILVGGPLKLIPWIDRCPTLEWIQST